MNKRNIAQVLNKSTRRESEAAPASEPRSLPPTARSGPHPCRGFARAARLEHEELEGSIERRETVRRTYDREIESRALRSRTGIVPDRGEESAPLADLIAATFGVAEGEAFERGALRSLSWEICAISDALRAKEPHYDPDLLAAVLSAIGDRARLAAELGRRLELAAGEASHG